MKDKYDVLDALVGFVSMAVIAPWIGSLIWNWYFVPLWDVPRIEFWAALMLAIVIKQFSYVRPSK